MELQDKVAIVTGASKGLGLAITQALLAEGVKVAGWSRTAPAIDNENFFYFAADVSNVDSVNNAYNHTIKHFGSDIHILINNAGVGYDGLLEEMPVDEWVRMFDVNVHGLFYCSQMVLGRMKELGEGHIVNIASIAGTMGTERFAGYCGTKFAVRGITQAMYKEVRDYGVKVSCVNPGSVQTEFFNSIESVTVNDNMMKPEWIGDSVIHLLKSPANYHPVELEVRPTMPKGRKVVNG